MNPSMMSPRSGTTVALLVLAVSLLAGCTTRSEPVSIRPDNVIQRLTPYRVEVQQGNVVTRDMATLVRPGMTRDQVREILGSPMLTDVFHAQRWDYIYSVGRGGGTPQQRLTVTVFFDGDRVERILAPELPTEHEFVARMAGKQAPRRPPPNLELTTEQRAKLPAPVRTEAEALPQPQGAQRAYPSLEPR